MLLYLRLVARHDITDAIDDSLILFFELITLYVCHFAAFLDWRKTSLAISVCFNRRFSASEVGVVPSFALKVDKLFCLFDIHQIILITS